MQWFHLTSLVETKKLEDAVQTMFMYAFICYSLIYLEVLNICNHSGTTKKKQFDCLESEIY